MYHSPIPSVDGIHIPTCEELDSVEYEKLYVYSSDVSEYRRNKWIEHPGVNDEGKELDQYCHTPCPTGSGYMVFMFRRKDE